MVRPDKVRKLALDLPNTTEQDHHGFPSYRVGGRIFATQPDADHVHVMLEPDDIRAAVEAHADCCEEKWWGKTLSAVRVSLPDVSEKVLRGMLLDAWERFEG